MRAPRKGHKPWKKGALSKRYIEPYSPTPDDRAFMDDVLLSEDASYLAFNKPSGLPSQTRNPDDRTFDKLLAVYAKSNGKRPKLVHRLDAQTSGVMIVARTKPAAAFFSSAFADRVSQKTYLAITSGVGDVETSGVIDQALQRYQQQPNLALMRPVSDKIEGALPARTKYEVVSHIGRYRIWRLKPETGRMHQLRAHLAHLGHPILGDPFYGGSETAEGGNVARLMLHALRLIIPHPESGELDLIAPVPHDMRELANQLGLNFGDATLA